MRISLRPYKLSYEMVLISFIMSHKYSQLKIQKSFIHKCSSYLRIHTYSPINSEVFTVSELDLYGGKLIASGL